jgi:hypothetical protein
MVRPRRPATTSSVVTESASPSDVNPTLDVASEDKRTTADLRDKVKKPRVRRDVASLEVGVVANSNNLNVAERQERQVLAYPVRPAAYDVGPAYLLNSTWNG